MAHQIPRRRQGRGLRCLQLVAVGSAALIAGPAVRSFIPASSCNRALRTRPVDDSFERGISAAGLLGAAAFPGQAVAADAADAGSSLLPVLGGLAVLAGIAAVLLAEPGKEDVNDKEVVEKYFNGEGFGRWQKIYGETEDVNPVQMDIRVGHAQTLDKILNWLSADQLKDKTVCDAGCGTGNLSIPLASRGAKVSGSDISSAMVGEAAERAKAQLPAEQVPQFMTSDLEALSGKYDCVCCVDVLIHYPPERLDGMVSHLSSLSNDRLILSFAPKTWYYTALKRIGELFPGKSKTTRAYLHSEEVVEDALKKAGFEVTRREMTSTNFYFSRLFEARPKATA